MEINDLQAGKVGEYLVCADLILNGHVAFPTEQGLPYDIMLVSHGRRPLKVQVKTTRQPQAVPQRKNRTDKYIFHVRRCGKGGHKKYEEDDVDIFALVALDTKAIGYLWAANTRQTMFFLPENGKIATKKRGGVTLRMSEKLSDFPIEKCLK